MEPNPWLKFTEETGGIFFFEDVTVIPYNHWKKDYDWLVHICIGYRSFFISANGLNGLEASINALKKLYDSEVME